MKNLLWGIVLLGCLFQACTNRTTGSKSAVGETGNELYLFVGSYAPATDKGIQVYSFNQATGDYRLITATSGVSNPSFLALSARTDRVYAVGEDEGETATVNVLKFDKDGPALTLMGSALTKGGAPCNLSLSPEEDYILTANYFGGNVSIFPLDDKGMLKANEPHLLTFNGRSVHPERQTRSYLHSVQFTSDKKYLIANDLGADRLYMFPVYPKGAKDTEGKPLPLLDESGRKDIRIQPGSGPRHLCTHPNGKYYYLLNELSGTVVSMRYEHDELVPFQYMPADSVGAEGSADIHISADGRFVYASNRLKADGIAIFSVHPEDGVLTKVGYQDTGIHPRNFILTPNDKYLLVACRDDNEVQLYERDLQSGLLKDTGRRIKLPRPVCLKFAQQ